MTRFLLLACALGAFVWAPVWADAKSDLLQRIEAITHLAADFSQTQYGPAGHVLEQATGYVRLLNPKLRWEVVSPHPQIIVADGDELKIYDPDLEQVTTHPMDEFLDGAPVALLMHPASVLQEDYQVERLDQGAFRLRPNSDAALVSEVILTFGPSTLEAIAIQDPLGHRTDIQFSKFSAAAVIQSDDFMLDLPEGIEFH